MFFQKAFPNYWPHCSWFWRLSKCHIRRLKGKSNFHNSKMNIFIMFDRRRVHDLEKFYKPKQRSIHPFSNQIEKCWERKPNFAEPKSFNPFGNTKSIFQLVKFLMVITSFRKYQTHDKPCCFWGWECCIEHLSLIKMKKKR